MKCKGKAEKDLEFCPDIGRTDFMTQEGGMSHFTSLRRQRLVKYGIPNIPTSSSSWTEKSARPEITSRKR